MIKRSLWWWVVLLTGFLIVLRLTGSGSFAWSVVQYGGLTVIGLVVLVNLIAGFLEVRERRRNPDRED